MADIAASVLTRLKNKAQASGRIDDFNAVLKTIKEFLTKPFIAAVKSKAFTEKWSAANGEWM
jgi:hypothetical protein